MLSQADAQTIKPLLGPSVLQSSWLVNLWCWINENCQWKNHMSTLYFLVMWAAKLHLNIHQVSDFFLYNFAVFSSELMSVVSYFVWRQVKLHRIVVFSLIRIKQHHISTFSAAEAPVFYNNCVISAAQTSCQRYLAVAEGLHWKCTILMYYVSNCLNKST